MEYMTLADIRCNYSGDIPEKIVIAPSNLSSRLVLFIHILQLNAENCSLNSIESRIVPNDLVIILPTRSVHSQHASQLRNVIVISGKKARVTKRAEVLGGKERERSRVTDAPRS